MARGRAVESKRTQPDTCRSSNMWPQHGARLSLAPALWRSSRIPAVDQAVATSYRCAASPCTAPASELEARPATCRRCRAWHTSGAAPCCGFDMQLCRQARILLPPLPRRRHLRQPPAAGPTVLLASVLLAPQAPPPSPSQPAAILHLKSAAMTTATQRAPEMLLDEVIPLSWFECRPQGLNGRAGYPWLPASLVLIGSWRGMCCHGTEREVRPMRALARWLCCAHAAIVGALPVLAWAWGGAWPGLNRGMVWPMKLCITHGWVVISPGLPVSWGMQCWCAN